MIKHITKSGSAGLLMFLPAAFLTISSLLAEGAEMAAIYDIPVTTIGGEETTLQQYAGKVMMIVNVASKCGFTGQYEGLQALYEKYADAGLVVLGFPSNDFLGQEPGTEAEIMQFCKLNYGVTFPLFAKIKVKAGKGQHPLYRWLTGSETNPEFAGKISWNFNKFLIGRDGKMLDRFDSRDKPRDKKVVEAVERALGSAAE